MLVLKANKKSRTPKGGQFADGKIDAKRGTDQQQATQGIAWEVHHALFDEAEGFAGIGISISHGVIIPQLIFCR